MQRVRCLDNICKLQLQKINYMNSLHAHLSRAATPATSKDSTCGEIGQESNIFHVHTSSNNYRLNSNHAELCAAIHANRDRWADVRRAKSPSAMADSDLVNCSSIKLERICVRKLGGSSEMTDALVKHFVHRCLQHNNCHTRSWTKNSYGLFSRICVCREYFNNISGFKVGLPGSLQDNGGNAGDGSEKIKHFRLLPQCLVVLFFYINRW